MHETDHTKMKKVTIRAPEPKPDIDKAKRMYRTVVEIIRRHDEIMKLKRAYRDVFLSEAIMLRDRLQEYCEKLMFYCPGDYGRKAEEILWRKAFYEIIQLMKINKKHMTPNSSLESAYRTHLTSAMGYYHHLLCRLQSEYNLSLEGVVDFYYLAESRTHRKNSSSSSAVVKMDRSVDISQWTIEACHRCLVYLGDLARYQHDYDGMPSKVLAQRYYYQALALCPEVGMPNNQLGTLAGNSYYGLDAAYYYIRCIVCPTPFDGAHSNLLRLFEKNRKRLTEIGHPDSGEGVSPEQQRSRDVKRFVSRFLQLLDIFYTKSRSLNAKGIQDVCQTALHDFNLCMFSQSSRMADEVTGLHSSDDKPCHLDDEMVFKIFVICLAMIHLMQKEGNKQVAAAIAFSLALFSHALNHAMMRLQTALYELENPARLFSSASPDGVSSCADAEENLENGSINYSKRANSMKNKKHLTCKHQIRTSGKDEDEKNDKKKGKKQLSKLRRMRRRRGSGSSSASDGNTALSRNNSDVSSEEEMNHSEDSEHDDGRTSHFVELSSSESDDDDLMVSQEMKPGFSSVGPEVDEGAGDERTTDLECHLDMAMDALGGTIIDGIVNNQNLVPSKLQQQQQQKPLQPMTGIESFGLRKQSVSDMTEFLSDYSLDWLSDAANLLHQTLQFTYSAAYESSANSDVLNSHDRDISAVIHGTRQVRVPPGFETSNESRHVLEISEKLANFEIETDTDISICPTDAENSTVTESEMDTEAETDKESDRRELQEKKLHRLIQVVRDEGGLLSSIKVYCDWLRINPHIIVTCAKISSSIWYRLSVLLNFLPSEMDLNNTELCNSAAVQQIVASAVQNDGWTPSQPLTEDIHLRKFTALDAAHKNLQFGMHARLDLSLQQEAILRICYLHQFGYFVAHLKSVNFTFSKDTGMFYGPQQAPTPNIINDRKAEQDLVNAEARRNQLMKDMAQLRLKAEVSQLEGSLRSTDAQPKLPPYLVPDAMSLCDHWTLLKQLATSSKFIIIVPVAVVDHLDVLKKDLSGAREAIRWLEAEFRKGNRFVRAQKQHENNLPVQPKYMKKDKDLWRTVQIVDCCNYLSKKKKVPTATLR